MKQAIREAQQQAKSLRGEWDLGHDPVDIMRVLDDHGYDLVRWPMESDVSGCLARVPEVGPVIFINTRDRTLGHQRFTAAHELYHLRFGDDETVQWEDLRDRENKSSEERRADAFAAQFLLPGPGLSAALEDLGKTGKDLEVDDVIEVQMRFGVSYEFLVYRLNNLGFLSGHKKNRLLENVQPVRRALELGYEASDLYGDEGPFFPKRFRSLAFRAVKENEISLKKLRSVLELDADEYARYRRILKEDQTEDHARREPVQSREEIVERLTVRPDVSREYGIEKFVLFGSAVRGELGPDSDLDMVVFAEGVEDYWTLTELRQRLEGILGRKVDLATPSMVEDIWEEEIAEEGVELHAA